MLSRANLKQIKSLQIKKHRNETGLFVAEGYRLVSDLLASNLQFESILHTSECPELAIPPGINTQQVSSPDMARLSGLKSPSPVLAILRIPELALNPNEEFTGLILALDDVQDPGNLGTIIRLADWFGVKHIVCSNNTADAYSPKVVQASMGAIGRVRVWYSDLVPFIRNANEGGLPVFGTFLEGESIYKQKFTGEGVIVLGNEGNGISERVADLVSHRITIPSYPPGANTSESLNVAMATGIVLSEVRRGGGVESGE